MPLICIVCISRVRYTDVDAQLLASHKRRQSRFTRPDIFVLYTDVFNPINVQWDCSQNAVVLTQTTCALVTHNR